MNEMYDVNKVNGNKGGERSMGVSKLKEKLLRLLDIQDGFPETKTVGSTPQVSTEGSKYVHSSPTYNMHKEIRPYRLEEERMQEKLRQRLW